MHTAWKHIHRCTDTSARIAGRIHRLGQSKEVLVKRFCFRDRCAPLPAHTPLLLRRFRGEIPDRDLLARQLGGEHHYFAQAAQRRHSQPHGRQDLRQDVSDADKQLNSLAVATYLERNLILLGFKSSREIT
jgi:hypothetical protein